MVSTHNPSDVYQGFRFFEPPPPVPARNLRLAIKYLEHAAGTLEYWLEESLDPETWAKMDEERRIEGLRTARDGTLAHIRVAREVLECLDECLICGCTDLEACSDGCYWVEPGICSTCWGHRQCAGCASVFTSPPAGREHEDGVRKLYCGPCWDSKGGY